MSLKNQQEENAVFEEFEDTAFGRLHHPKAVVLWRGQRRKEARKKMTRKAKYNRGKNKHS